MAPMSFPGLPELALQLRAEMAQKKFVLLYAYNGTGKTRLSVAFKGFVKTGDERDTLYFNAFTDQKRFIDLMSHGDYSLYEPREMMEENKGHFRTIFRQFIAAHPFNPALFPNAADAEADA